MELKYDKEAILVGKKVGSNRTFMELKYSNNAAVVTEYDVLIVPLWN